MKEQYSEAQLEEIAIVTNRILKEVFAGYDIGTAVQVELTCQSKDKISKDSKDKIRAEE